jgi:regulatory protein
MQKLLKRRATSDLLAQVVLARLNENGSLNDDRYAKQFTRQRTEIRRQGKFRIARDLRARGVPDAHIQSAIQDATDEAAERATIRHRIDRKLKLTRGDISDKKIASLYRSLLAAGFPSDAIRRELKSITSEGFPTSNGMSDPPKSERPRSNVARTPAPPGGITSTSTESDSTPDTLNCTYTFAPITHE